MTIDIDTIHLTVGKHATPEDGMCAMELAAVLAGEPFTDHPECVSLIIAAFFRSWNDSLPDTDRDRLLKPLIPLTLGTRSTTDVEDRRAWMACDWLVRVHTPTWLRLAGLTGDAEALEALPPLEPATIDAARPTIISSRDHASAARAAAGDAAWDAARAVAWAAGVAAGAAAWDVAWATAWDAAWVAARDAARDAVWATAMATAMDAARAAALAVARDALAPTVTILQLSAVDLIRRMCADS